MDLKSFLQYARYVRENCSIRIPRHQKVIDIGSGHAPLIRADVLCDMFVRHGSQRPVPSAFLVAGRFVVADVLDLPFRDKAFDFAYSKNLLEHVSDPLRACGEISRIAEKGLLHLPSRLWEIMGGSPPHLWLIWQEGDKLVFERKTRAHTALNSQIPARVRDSSHYERLFRCFPDLFYITHRWRHTITAQTVFSGDEADYHHFDDQAQSLKTNNEDVGRGVNRVRSLPRLMRFFLYEAIRRLLGGRNTDLFSLLACPICKQTFTQVSSDLLFCGTCKLNFPVVNGIPILTKQNGVRG